MGRDHIGYYAHHQGAGHVERARRIGAHVDAPFTVLTEVDLGEPTDLATVTLPSDRPVGGAAPHHDPTAHGALHWVPLRPDVLAPRTRTLVEWMSGPDVAGMVCDVSVEAQVLARLCGLPTIVVRGHGVRDDPAHTLSYQVAQGLLAPFPELLEDPETPAELRARTFYAGFTAAPVDDLDRRAARRSLGLPDDGVVVLVALGAGGQELQAEHVAQLAREVPEAFVVNVGPLRPAAPAAPAATRAVNLRDDGWVDELTPYLVAADVVVGSAGANLVAEIAAVGRPFLCLPQRRPFEEQQRRARRLADLGLARVHDEPLAPGAWRAEIDACGDLDPTGWAALRDGGSASDAARWIEDVLVGGAGR